MKHYITNNLLQVYPNRIQPIHEPGFIIQRPGVQDNHSQRKFRQLQLMRNLQDLTKEQFTLLCAIVQPMNDQGCPLKMYSPQDNLSEINISHFLLTGNSQQLTKEDEMLLRDLIEKIRELTMSQYQKLNLQGIVRWLKAAAINRHSASLPRRKLRSWLPLLTPLEFKPINAEEIHPETLNYTGINRLLPDDLRKNPPYSYYSNYFSEVDLAKFSLLMQQHTGIDTLSIGSHTSIDEPWNYEYIADFIIHRMPQIKTVHIQWNEMWNPWHQDFSERRRERSICWSHLIKQRLWPILALGQAEIMVVSSGVNYRNLHNTYYPVVGGKEFTFSLHAERDTLLKKLKQLFDNGQPLREKTTLNLIQQIDFMLDCTNPLRDDGAAYIKDLTTYRFKLLDTLSDTAKQMPIQWRKSWAEYLNKQQRAVYLNSEEQKFYDDQEAQSYDEQLANVKFNTATADSAVKKAATLLEINEGMTFSLMRKIFREKLFSVHPDRNKGADIEEKCKSYNHAKDVLTNFMKNLPGDNVKSGSNNFKSCLRKAYQLQQDLKCQIDKLNALRKAIDNAQDGEKQTLLQDLKENFLSKEAIKSDPFNARSILVALRNILSRPDYCEFYTPPIQTAIENSFDGHRCSNQVRRDKYKEIILKTIKPLPIPLPDREVCPLEQEKHSPAQEECSTEKKLSTEQEYRALLFKGFPSMGIATSFKFKLDDREPPMEIAASSSHEKPRYVE